MKTNKRFFFCNEQKNNAISSVYAYETKRSDLMLKADMYMLSKSYIPVIVSKLPIEKLDGMRISRGLSVFTDNIIRSDTNITLCSR